MSGVRLTLQSRATKLDEVLAFEFAQSASDRLPRGANEFGNLLVCQRQLDASAVFCLLPGGCEIQQELGQFSGRRSAKAQIPELLAGNLIMRAELARHERIGLRVFGKEAQKRIVGNEGYLGGPQRLGGHFVGLS